MLKTTLLTAAAAFVIMAAAPISSHAQGSGLRQIVVDPSAAGGGGGDGSGGGTGGGDQNGTGGGKKKLVIQPLIADPAGTASVDSASGSAPVDTGTPAASGDGGDKAKGPAPVATLGGQPADAGKPDALDAIVGTPAVSGGDKLDAIKGDQPGAAPIEVKPAEIKPADQGGAPAAAAKTEGAPIKDVGGLIVALKTGGFEADIDHRDNKGDYYVIVTTPKDHSFGYLLTVDDKSGHVLEKQKIDPTKYGYYAETPDYGKAKSYDQPDSGYTDDNSYGGGSDDSSGEGYGSSGGSGY